jgi:cardiolipin synthase A/B
MPTLHNGHHVTLLESGREFFPALIEVVQAAQHAVYLETYIFDVHGVGGQVAQALAEAARRGVQVRVVMDAAGTGQLSPGWQVTWQEAGVQWQMYKPLGPLALFIPSRWRRLHRKLCVVDHAVAFCGGINVLDDLHDPNHGALPFPRLDFAVRVTGPLVSAVLDAVQQLWWRGEAVREVKSHEMRAAWGAAQAAARRYFESQAQQVQGKGVAGHMNAALVLRDNVRHRRRIEGAYLKAIAGARHEIIIANAYFLPGGRLRRALLLAARRGVKIKLLLQGRYEYFMQYHAARPVYSQLLQAGVEIHEYEPSFLHAKVAVIDAHHAHAWATVGSSNLDPLSFLLAREANVVVRDGHFAQVLHAKLLHAIDTAGKQIELADYEDRSLWQRLLNWSAYFLMRLTLAVLGKRY